MLSLLPVFLLLLAAGVVLTLRLRGVNTGVCWLVSVGAALVVWGLTLSLHWWSPAPLLIENWLPGGMSAGSVRFEWGRSGWVFAFSLSSLLLATLFTASVRLLPVSPIIWAGVTAVTGVGMLAVLAASPMALILGWTLLDALELGILLANLRGARQTARKQGLAARHPLDRRQSHLQFGRLLLAIRPQHGINRRARRFRFRAFSHKPRRIAATEKLQHLLAMFNCSLKHERAHATLENRQQNQSQHRQHEQNGAKCRR